MPPPKFQLPNPNTGIVTRMTADLGGNLGGNKEIDRALPSSKGGETPKQLQTYRTSMFAFFTKSSLESELLYSAENWVIMKLELETAGPVAIGTDADIVPVLGGKGIVLDATEPVSFTLAKGTRVYITSETINRVNVIVEPIPWFEQLDLDLVQSERNTQAAIVDLGNRIVAALGALQAGTQVASTPPAAPPARTPLPVGLPRLPTQLPRLRR